MNENPEIGRSLQASGLRTNYHDVGSGPPVVFIHGSGPGVTAWANWRTVIPELARDFRVIAPDIAGFGYTERKAGVRYDLDFWVNHLLGLLDALGIERTSIVGNSFGGGLALALATREPKRVERLVLMGSAGVSFPLTPGLDLVWGYTPSLELMSRMLPMFVYDKSLAREDLIRMRFEASQRPGYQETYGAMFPAPRQRCVDALTSPREKIAALQQETLILHGRDDAIIPLESSIDLHRLISRSQLHVFGRCGHWTQIEQGARFCRLVSEFLREARS